MQFYLRFTTYERISHCSTIEIFHNFHFFGMSAAYYDSDDDVAWGPITLREVKRKFRDPVVRKINKRHTVHPEISNLGKVMEKCNITNSSNEYQTPNVTINKETKLLSSADNSDYSSCTEGTVKHSSFENAQMKANNRQTEYNLKIEQPTDVLQDSCLEDSVDSQDFEDDVIVLSSSDEDNVSFVSAKPNQAHDILPTVKVSQFEEADNSSDSVQNISCENEELETSDKLEPAEVVQENITIGGEMPQQYVDLSPIQIPKLDLAAFDETEDCLKLNDTLEEIDRLLNAESESTQDTQSCHSSTERSSSAIPALDNHLETSYDASQDSSISDPRSSLDPGGRHFDIISGSFLQAPSCSIYNKETIPISEPRNPTPRKLKSPMKLHDHKIDKLKPSPVLIRTPGDPTGQFRVPTSLTKQKSTVLNNKNIVSPVGLYIKYSPRSPLVTHVKPKLNDHPTLFSHKPSIPKSANDKENIIDLPQVVYQPARKQLYTVNEELVLPSPLAGMVKTGRVVKHERRIRRNEDKDEIVNKLNNESELTRSNIGSSMLEESTLSSQDVSVLASRQAFRK